MESDYERRKREYIHKIAMENRAHERRLGLCRCSTTDGVFLRDLYEDGCPYHPSGPIYVSSVGWIHDQEKDDGQE